MKWVKASETDLNNIGGKHWRDSRGLPLSASMAYTLFKRGELVEYLNESTPEVSAATTAKDYEREYVFAKLELAEAHKEIARLKEKIASDLISIDELQSEFKRQGIDTSSWDGDEGAEKAIVDGVIGLLSASREDEAGKMLDFAEYFRNNFEYYDCNANGSIYKNVSNRSESAMTMKEILSKWNHKKQNP